MKKSDREIMEILEAFDATGAAHSAAPLCGADPKTVRRYAQARDLGGPVTEPVARPKLIDPFLGKVEEWVDRSEGRVRADVVHERLAAMGFAGTERTARRAVAAAKARWRAGHRRTYRPWITYLKQWVPAGKLKKGDHLQTADGVTAVADGGITPKQYDGWMWDLTIPGDHDFYIQATTTAILVHNINPFDCSDEGMLARLPAHSGGETSGIFVNEGAQLRSRVASADLPRKNRLEPLASTSSLELTLKVMLRR